MRTRRLSLILLIALGITSFQSQTAPWIKLEEGLHYVSLQAPTASPIGDSKIDVLRINPANFKFELLCAEEQQLYNRAADVWCTEFDLVAGVNASMFRLEGTQQVSTGFMKNFKHVNNAELNPSFKTVFAFNPKDSTQQGALLIDITCSSWEQEQKKYNSFSQSLRMMDCHGNNVWKLNEKKWSMVVLGEDIEGNILFIFVRSPYRVAEYIEMLKKLPLNLKLLMYLEGGPEASLYVNHPQLHLEKFGSYETGFNENDDNRHFWKIPNLIGIKRKKSVN